MEGESSPQFTGVSIQRDADPELPVSLLFHGGDTGSIPVRDAKAITYKSHVSPRVH